MNKRVIGSLYKKEMTDILRDKKTILMMIVIPLILYPLIFVGSMYLASSMINASTTSIYRIGFDNVPNEAELKYFIAETAKEYDYQFLYVMPDGMQNDGIVTVIQEDGEHTVYRSYEEALKNGYLDAYLTVGQAADIDETAVAESLYSEDDFEDINGSDNRDSISDAEIYRIVYLASENRSQTAASMLADMLGEYRNELREEQLILAGLDPDAVLFPIQYEYQDISSNEETMGSLLGYIVPFLMITSILMGAMYPAIDTTAGEKERGTLETMLTLPVRNLEMIVSKFLATSTVAVAAALLNLISMGLLGLYMIESMQSASETVLEFDLLSYLPAIAVMILCVAVFALFASAVCLSVCIFAKSFKEAQNYTTPVMLVFMLAGMVGMIPSMELDGVTSILPVVNIALLIMDLFKLKFNMAVIAVVLFSNVAYSMFAIVIMTRLFNSENILFGDGAGSIRLLEKRSNMKEKQIPGVGDLLLLFSVLLIFLMFAGSIAILKYGVYGLIGEQLGILCITVLYCWYIKTDFRAVFGLKRPRIMDLITGTMIWIGAYVIMLLLIAVLSVVFPGSAESAGGELLQIWEGTPVWLVVISSAVFPAICEETAFRGFLFGTLSKKYRIPAAILFTGAIFGLYHMNLIQFFAVGFFGGVMAYVVYKTGSILVSMWMHFLNNLFAVMLAVYEEEMTSFLPILADENPGVGSVLILLVMGMIIFTVGILLLNRERFIALKR